MPGPERLTKLKSRRVVHKSTGGVLPRTPQPVDPVGNPPPPSPLNTVAHLPAAGMRTWHRLQPVILSWICMDQKITG
jgi:hypothetical protein